MAFKLKNEGVKKIIGELRKASKLHAGQADKLQKMITPLKQDRTPGSQNPNFPDVMYTKDGKAIKSVNIDEGRLDFLPSIGPKGRFVNYTENGKKTKYYYKNPKKAPDQAKFSDLEKEDDDRN